MPDKYISILVVKGRLLSPESENAFTEEEIVILQKDPVVSIPLPPKVSSTDEYFRHDSRPDGRLTAELFLELIAKGVTLLAYLDPGSTRTFLRVTEDFIYIFKKDMLLEKGTCAFMNRKDFMTAFESQRDEYFSYRVINILEGTKRPTQVEVTTATAAHILNWNGEKPKGGSDDKKK